MVIVLDLFLVSCDLENEIPIDLPDYEPQVVVESYLQGDKPLTLLLTNSTPFFEPFNLQDLDGVLDNTFVQGAEVQIHFDDKTVMLDNTTFFDPLTGAIANYYSPEKLDSNYRGEISLEIILENGDEIESSTRPLEITPFDSLVVEYNDDSLARVLTYVTDDTTSVDFYRRVLHETTLDSVPDQDFLVEDKLSENGIIAFGTGYDFERGDTVINTLYHIDKAYYDYLLSVELSIAANLDPITQPGTIFSNVGGSANPLGIFTVLSYVRDTTIIGQ